MRTLILTVTLLCVVSLTIASEPATMADFVGAVREAAGSAGLAVAEPDRSEELEANLAIIEASGVDPLSVEEVAANLCRPGLMTLSRRNRAQYAFGSLAAHELSRLQVAIDRVRQIANDYIYESLSTAVGEATADGIFKPLTDYHRAILNESLGHNLEKMRRFEKKFGPRAPRLNALEVGVNFLLQRVPGFYPTDEKGPGPLEIVASYDTAYLTVVGEEPELISTAGFGIRYYLLGDGWGEEDGLTGFLKPGYFSLGVLVAPEEDGALVWPWHGEERLGGFLTWGEFKLAYVGGDEDRFMVSREFQMVPWLF